MAELDVKTREIFLEKDLKDWKKVRDKTKTNQRLTCIFMGIAGVILIGAFFILNPLPKEKFLGAEIDPEAISYSFLVIGSAFVLLGIIILPIARPSTLYDNQIVEIENDLDLLKIGDAFAEQRAEKQFKVHQSELKRYYDQSLKHGSWIFLVGIISLLIGFIIVGISLYLVYWGPNSDSNVIIAILGGVAGILTNFIGVIYLKMYSETIKSANEFHNRLVVSNHLHFSNFLISKIKNDDLRENTLATLALSLLNKENNVDEKSGDE